MPAPRLGPAFALVQLLRAEAAFLLAPLLLRAATGIHDAALLVGGTAGAGAVVLTGVLLLGGSPPQAPHIQRWVDGDGPAFDSPPLAALLRGRSP